MKITGILKETPQSCKKYEIGENGVFEVVETSDSYRHYVVVYFSDGMIVKVCNPDYVYYQQEAKE